MLSLFAVVMVINAWVTTVAARRVELARLRLLGATPRQVRGSILVEGGFVAALGVLVGLVASLATVVPFAVARHEGVVPDGGLWLPPLLMAGAAAVTLASAGLAARRASVHPMLAMAGEAPVTHFEAMSRPWLRSCRSGRRRSTRTGCASGSG